MSQFGEHQDTVIASQQNYGSASRVVPAMLDVTFICLMRSQSFFDEARRFIRSNQFDPAREQHYAVLWEVLCTLRDSGSRFTCANVLTEVHRVLSDDPGYLHPHFQPFLLRQDGAGLVFGAFNAPVEEVDVHTARAHLREFLHERTVASPLRRFMESVNTGDTPAGLNDFLDQIVGQRQSIAAMDTLPSVIAAPDLNTVLEAPSIFNPTGIDWIDHPLGGIRQGDSIGILGGTGSGKSTLGAHIAVACAKREFQRSQEESRDARWVGFMTYEESVKKMRVRVWSAGFQILRERLENLTHPAQQLTHRGNMMEYERRLYGQDQDQPLSEQDRWAAGASWMNKTLKLFDMSGSADFPNAGRGYIPEIVACLDATAQRTGTAPVLVPIDYAGIVCRNYINATGRDENSLRPLLAEFGNMCRREIAERFGCTVLILHQIAPAEGQRNATALLHHSMAAESRAFAENLAACACIGNPDPTTGCRRLNWSKIRYQAQEKVEPVTVRINDQFAQMEDVSSIYAVDDSGRRFVPREALQRVHGGETQQTVTTNPPQIQSQVAPGADFASGEAILSGQEENE